MIDLVAVSVLYAAVALLFLRLLADSLEVTDEELTEEPREAREGIWGPIE